MKFKHLSIIFHTLSDLENPPVFRTGIQINLSGIFTVPTSSDRNANQIVDQSKDEVDPDPLDCLLGEVDTADNVQQVILQAESKSETENVNNKCSLFTKS